MTNIKAPFNFVPISESVYFPEWQSMISFDKPFKDSCSGIIELEIETQTPIYIRNSYSKQEKEEAMEFAEQVYDSVAEEIEDELTEDDIKEKKAYLIEKESNPNKKKKINDTSAINALVKEKLSDQNNSKQREKIITLLNEGHYTYFDFFNINNTYIIPGSSLKGCIRSVLEILSFGKFRISKQYTPGPIENINFQDKIPQSHNSKKFDLADCIFGSADENNSLKGRVHISNAHCTNQSEVETCSFIMSAMSSPKPSYYPFYLEQDEIKCLNVVNLYTDYSQDFTLKGRKRYPIHKKYQEPEISIFDSASKIASQAVIFRPIENAKFVFKIRFFNLLSEELGALLSAITFHNQAQCYHNIGLGKGFGLGKIRINITNTTMYNKPINNIDDYIDKFESLMTNKFDIEWKKSQPLIELYEMAKGKGKQILSYMSINEYNTAKERNEFLDLYSFIKNGTHKHNYDIPTNLTNLTKDTEESNESESESEKFISTDTSNAQIGDTITVHCYSNKKVQTKDLDNIQLVIPKEFSRNNYINKIFNVVVTQKSKDGKVCQVKITE